MAGANNKFWRLYDHLRRYHELTPQELDNARTFRQLKFMHEGVAPRCPWRPKS